MAESAPDIVYAANMFNLRDPADAGKVVDMIRTGVTSTSSRNPGFIADVLYQSLDGRTLMNFSTWSGGVAQLMANHEANQANPRYAEQMADVGVFADAQSSAYTKVFEHGRAADGEITPDDVHRWLDAWNSHDLDRILDLFTEDVIMHQPQNPQPLDKAGLTRFFSGLFSSYPDIHFELQGHTIQGRDVASWERVTGTMTGEFHDPASGKAIPPTGKRFDILGAMHLTYGDNARIREVRIYWDRLLMMQQVGLLGS